MKLWSSKRSLCARLPSKMKLYKAQKRSFSARLPSKTTRRPDTWPQNSNMFLSGYWMLQKYCACHEKVQPRHTNSCNCHTKGSLQSNTSVTWNLQPFHRFNVQDFKSPTSRRKFPCACHAKSILSIPLQIHHACQCFCNPHELLPLPRISQRVETPAPATRKALSTSKNVLRPSILNDYWRLPTLSLSLARRRGANFGDANFQKCSEPASF